MMHGSRYVTNTNLKKIVDYMVLYFINNEDQEALVYKTLRPKDAVASFERIMHRSPFACVLLVFSYVTASKISLLYV